MGKQFAEYHINGKVYRFNIFDKIETKEQAYLIGYLLGDGGLQPKTNKRKARLYVTSIEEDLIKFIQKEFMPDNTYSSRIPVNKKRNIKSNRPSYKITFSSKFSNSFEKFGILDKKENRTFHHIPKKFMSQFLLGLLDSDGFIGFGRRKDRNRLWCHFGIIHPSLKALKKIQNFLLNELNIPSSIEPKSKEKCYILRFSKVKNVAKIVKYIYQDKPVYCHRHKERTAQEFLKNLEQ